MKKSKLLNIYKIALALFILALIFMPKNVTSLPEIETKLLLTAVGIDRNGDEYTLSATDVMPAESQDGTLRRLNVDATGASISECLAKLSIKMGKKLELGLCGLVLLGKDMRDYDVTPDLEYLLSSGKIIPGAYLAFCPDKTAKETLEMANSLSEASSNGLVKLLEHNEIDTHSSSITLLKFLSDGASTTNSAFMPCLVLQKKSSDGSGSGDSGDSGDGGGGQQSGSGGGESGKQESEVQSLDEIALFSGGKYVTRLDKTQTLGLTWLDRNSMHGLVTLDELTVDGRSVGKLHATLSDKKISYKTNFDDEPKMTVNIIAELMLEDRSNLTKLYRKYGVSENQLSTAITDGFSKKIENELTSYETATKAANCDAMGLSDRLYRLHYKSYTRYAQPVYQNMQISYKIDVKIH